jgi:hypothetical protein
MANSYLIKGYKEFYSKIRGLVKDDEIFPELTDTQFEEFVSQENWMGVPSFSASKKEMTNSDHGHVGIVLRENNQVWLTLWFNGTKAVNRFVNILKDISEKEKTELVLLIKNLDERYKIQIRYTEKFFAASPDWNVEGSFKCKNLTEETIDGILRKIKEVKDKRDMQQKMIPSDQIATLAVSLAEIEIDKNDDNQLKEVLSNLAKIARICHDIKSDSQLSKIKKVQEKEIEELKDELEVMEKRKETFDLLKRVGRLKEEDIKKLNDKKEGIIRKIEKLEQEIKKY